ncbi:hypothetical protein AAVH_36431 [Aphelenchoides avenae]|nr:hypothetical protein AAVH_36431 [Aphelenchus avenae]
MMVGAVVSSERSSGPQTPLDHIVQARKAVYINRFRETSELCAKLQVNRNASLTSTTLFGIELAIRAEFAVVCDFFRQSGVREFIGADAEVKCPRLATSFLSTWVIYEWMWATVRNFGHYSRRLFFLDETYLDVTDGSLSEMYGTDAQLIDPWHIGR